MISMARNVCWKLLYKVVSTEYRHVYYIYIYRVLWWLMLVLGTSCIFYFRPVKLVGQVYKFFYILEELRIQTQKN